MSVSPARIREQQRAEWERYFAIVPIHDSLMPFLMGYIGNWPKDVDASSFAGGAYIELADRIRALIDGPYPLAAFKGHDNPPKPSYERSDRWINRGSNIALDMLVSRTIREIGVTNDDPRATMWRVIQRHSSTRFAKLIFTLPRLLDASSAAASGAVVVLVEEDLMIQVYKGVENAIFGAYEDLDEYGYLTDHLIEQKLHGLLTTS